MGVHDFDFTNFNDQQVQQSFESSKKTIPAPNSSLVNAVMPAPTGDPAARQNDDRNCEPCEPCPIDDQLDLNFVDDEVREVYPAGFYNIDKGIKNYFSGIRIPVGRGTEEYKMLPVRIAGFDPEAMVYGDQNLNGGRLTLPFLSISRTGETYDPERYSPPIRPIHRHMICNGRESENVYRPVPFLVDYTLEIKAEHKSEAEFALYSIISKLNPIGSFFLEEDSMGMSFEIIVHPKGSTDNSDLEVDDSTKEEVKKSVTIQVEAWLPTPTKVVPNILARPVTIREGIHVGSQIKIPGETLSVIRDRS